MDPFNDGGLVTFISLQDAHVAIGATLAALDFPSSSICKASNALDCIPRFRCLTKSSKHFYIGEHGGDATSAGGAADFNEWIYGNDSGVETSMAPQNNDANVEVRSIETCVLRRMLVLQLRQLI